MAVSTEPRYEVTYQGRDPIQGLVTPSNYAAAQMGDAHVRSLIMANYVAKLAEHNYVKADSVEYEWGQFRIKPVPHPPHAAVTASDPRPDVGEGGCGCNCYNCDTRAVHCKSAGSGCKI